MLERKDFIDGLVITGGEPCLYDDLPEFIQQFKELGFLVKLDTNGTNPEMLKQLIENSPAAPPANITAAQPATAKLTGAQPLVDYIAMDIKAPLDEEKYRRAVGLIETKFDLEQIKQSVALLLSQSAGSINYEFRLTVVPGLINETDIEEIGRQLKGAKKFVLQQFVPQNCLAEEYSKIKPYEKNILRSFQVTLKQYIHNTVLRGV
jgi:pyruvate formate lyase activating enzyme